MRNEMCIRDRDDSLILKLLEKMSIQGPLFINRVEELLNKRPKVQGGQVFVGQDLNNALIHAEDEAKQMGDEYVSVEHIFLSLLKYASRDLKPLFREFGISCLLYTSWSLFFVYIMLSIITVQFLAFTIFSFKIDDHFMFGRQISEVFWRKDCKLRLNGMPVPLLRNGYSIFNGTKYR